MFVVCLFDLILYVPSTTFQLYRDRSVATVSVNAPVSVNVDNNGRYRSPYCKWVYNSGTVSVNIDSNGSDLTRYCQRLHLRELVMIICMISTLFVNNVGFYFFLFNDRIFGP